ncbi:biosynthetic-type acetolactate synthase large subunit [bacterium]|nr:biosynthetic-type acetolactate synthase large subunit [bacterium]
MSEKESEKNPEISGARALVKVLELEGVDTIFGYPGGANLPILDELRKSTIRHVLPRHEQGGAHMADGYARVAGKTGVCLATSGPGATNLVTGLANAMLDSVPLIAITGQISRSLIGTDAFQEVDCINITMPVTKHNELVFSSQKLVEALKTAFYLANTGRKGPVLLDIPIDILEETYAHDLEISVELKGYNPTIVGNVGQVKRALKILDKAERPLVLFGGGIVSAGAVNVFNQFIRETNIPVVRTLMGTGVVDDNDPLYLGMIGTHGHHHANQAIQKEADVVFVVGTRLGNRALVKNQLFAKNAKIIHLDIDPAEIGKNIETNIPIVGDIKVVLEDMLTRISKKPIRKESAWTGSERKRTKLSTRDGASVMEIIFTQLSSIDLQIHISTDVGRHQMWANHFCTNPKHLPLITSGGLGTMGFGLPAAIGAWFADPQTPVISISGDGSFMMNMQEFVVAVENEIPLTVLIINDHRLSMIRELQRSDFGGRFVSHELGSSVDYVALAKAMGGSGSRITHKEQIVPTIVKSIKSKRPTIIDCDLEKIIKSSHLTIDSVAS